jgi:hypothetical protein
MRQTVTTVEEILAEGEEIATVAAVAKKRKIDRSAAYRRIRQCLDRGFLLNDEPFGKGKAMRISLGDPMPEDQSLLPTVEQVIALVKKLSAR